MRKTSEHPDGRSSRPWGIVKDEILKEFLPVYVGSMTKAQKIPILIDGFAGPGTYSDQTAGSPLIMLRTTYNAFKEKPARIQRVQFYFCERERTHLEKLADCVESFLREHVHIQHDQIHLAPGRSETELLRLLKEIENRASYVSPFLYLDPWGVTGVNKNLVFEFLQLRRIGVPVEVLLRFPPSQIFRFYRNPKLGPSWIHKHVAQIDLSDIPASGNFAEKRKRNFEILRRYVSSMALKYKELFGKALHYVAIEIPSSRPYYMIFFTENTFGCWAMGDPMIRGLAKYLEYESPLLSTSSASLRSLYEIGMKQYEPDKIAILKLIRNIRKTKQRLPIHELVASHYQDNIFPVFFSRPQRARITTMQDVLRELEEEGVIKKIDGRPSEAQTEILLS